MKANGVYVHEDVKAITPITEDTNVKAITPITEDTNVKAITPITEDTNVKAITPITERNEIMETLLRENEELKARVLELEKKVESLTKSITSKGNKEEKPMARESVKVIDWAVHCNEKDSKWYAGKRVDGKIRIVYIGRDLSKAETKIREYCQKHGIEIKKSDSEK
jgi:hypothetical protein